MYDSFEYRLPSMASERKDTMVSARVPKAVVTRLDYVTRNIDSETVRNRSAAMLAALEAWLPGQEKRLEELGIITKKAR